jgi:hypothetical protein
VKFIHAAELDPTIERRTGEAASINARAQAQRITVGWETTSTYRLGGPADTSLASAPSTFCAAPMKPKNAPRACSTVFFSEVDDLGRNPLWSVDHDCSPPAILRDVLDVTGSAGHGYSYRRNLESLLAFVSTYKQPRAKRRMPDSILGDLRSHLRA